jgi:hypothetical protein
LEEGSVSKAKGVALDDFVAYLPQHTYIFLSTREPWPGESVNSQFPPMALLDKNGNPVLDNDGEPKMISPARWLDINRPVHQMTWAPGMDLLIMDKVVADGGWVDKPGTTTLNLYRPPKLKGKRGQVKLWLDHIKRIYPNDADHIVKYLAHRLQHPFDKINHALMLGGAQGIGKDSLLEPLKHAVGPWNFAEVSPVTLTGTFNGFLKSVILRVSEARNTGGELSRFEAYDASKTYIAAPPDTLRVNEKYLREHYVFNCCSVIITTNYKTDGIYLPADDRRHYVAWSDAKREDFSKAYWNKLWGWYKKGSGFEAIAAYLAALDLSTFDAKAPPLQTDAFWAIVDANRAPEEGELADIFDKLGKPDAVTISEIKLSAGAGLDDKRNRRTIPHRMETVGYVPLRNTDTDSGLWTIDTPRHSWVTPIGKQIDVRDCIEGVRQVVYVKSALSPRNQVAAVQELRRKATEAATEMAKTRMASSKNGSGRRI